MIVSCTIKGKKLKVPLPHLKARYEFAPFIKSVSLRLVTLN